MIAVLVSSLNARAATNTNNIVSYTAATNLFRSLLSPSQFDTNATPFTITNLFGIKAFNPSQLVASPNGNLVIIPNALVTNLTDVGTFSGTNIAVGHLIGTNGSPTFGLTSNAGVGSTIAADASANDLASTITLTTAGTPASGILFTNIFAAAYTVAPHVVWSWSGPPDSTKLFYVSSVTTTNFTFSCTTGPAVGSHVWSFHVIQ